MRISIVITAYNAEETVERCLNSIESSGLDEVEIILVDDCSKDGLQERLALHEDTRLRIYSNNVNLGCGRSRNVGLAHATGKYITFLDADDWYLPGAVASILRSIEDDSVDLVVFDFQIIHRSSHVNNRWFCADGLLEDFLRDRLISTCWNKIYRTEVIQRNDIKFATHASQDSLFNVTYFLTNPKWKKLNEILYAFDKRNESITRSVYTKKSYNDSKLIISAMENELLSTFSSQLPRNLSNAFELRRFLFLFKAPILRLLYDWENEKLSRSLVDYIKRDLRAIDFNLFSLAARRDIDLHVLILYLVFLARPMFAIRLLHYRNRLMR